MGVTGRSFARCCLLAASLASCVDGEEDGGFGYLWLVFLLLGSWLCFGWREWKEKMKINVTMEELLNVELGFLMLKLFHVLLRRRGVTESETRKSLMLPSCSYNFKFTPKGSLVCMPESHCKDLKISKHPCRLNCCESTGGKILLVEDTELNRMLLRKLFTELNLLFEEAENGQIAVDYFKQGKNFDLVLMDKEMPVMDGHEATRQLRMLGVKTPIVALTGNSLQSDREMFFQAGANDFKTKPLSRADLILLLVRYGLRRTSSFQSGIK